jgi:hypothetical protein
MLEQRTPKSFSIKERLFKQGPQVELSIPQKLAGCFTGTRQCISMALPELAR